MKKLFIVLISGLFIADRFLKYIFYKNSHLSEDFGFLKFNLIKNNGIAFGLQLPQWLILIAIIFILFGIIRAIVIVARKKKYFQFWSLVLIFVGAISNLIDRIIYGVVIDYVDFGWWPVFNLADVMICVGVVILIIEIWENKK